jgi:CheY-like chemotaxis protein
LRNPLTPVIAMVTELEASATQSDDVRFALEVIRRNVELEARLIDDLLDVTRIARGKLQLTLEKVSIHEILRRAYEICRDEIVAKDLNTEFRLRADHDFVEADSARLQQVFWNLMKNSVKFTPAGGRIIVETANPAADRIEIRVTDTGIGIEPDQVERIFNAFEQGQSAITRRFGGLGLGLAISKAMVEAHNGEIRAESEGRDTGATFAVELQTVAAPVEARDGKTAPAAAGATNGVSSDGRPRRILVVDDHADTCIGLKMMLQRRGYEVETAHSASDALKKAESDDFDLLISDIGLPDRSGYELMQELRHTKSIRGIALSGYGMESDIRRAHDAGFAQHLTKPINFDQLNAAIRGLVAPEESVT